MKPTPNYAVENYRIAGEPGTNDGAFRCWYGTQELQVIVSDGLGWDHVSVSAGVRCPTWDEMCYVKDLFFKHAETVVQFHPAKSEYVNVHPFVLHLWRRHGVNWGLPPRECV